MTRHAAAVWLRHFKELYNELNVTDLILMHLRISSNTLGKGFRDDHLVQYFLRG